MFESPGDGWAAPFLSNQSFDVFDETIQIIFSYVPELCSIVRNSAS